MMILRGDEAERAMQRQTAKRTVAKEANKLRTSRRPSRSVRLASLEGLESRQLMAADLVAHWNPDTIDVANGAAITDWTDSVSKSVAARFGEPTLATNAVAGRSMVQFNPSNGVDGFRIRSAQNPISNTGDFSVVAAFMTSATDLRGTNGPWFQNTGLVDSSALGFSQDWGVGINATGQISAGMGNGFGSPSATLYSTASGLNDGQLHVIAVTRQGGEMTIRVDNQAPDTKTGMSSSTRSPLDLTLGMLQNESGGFSGHLGQVRIYKGAMTAEEATRAITDVRAYYSNSAPISLADQYTVNEDSSLEVAAAQGVLRNDSDADGDPLTAELVAGPQHGQLTLNADGSFRYVPDANFVGVDGFTYAGTDHRAGNVATVTLDVKPVYDPPLAVADAYQTSPGQTLQVAPAQGLLVNDTNIDGVSITAVLDQNVSNGTLTLRPDGSFTYAPGGFAGVATFTYRTTDGQTTSPAATVRLTVNTTPVVQNDLYTLNEDQTLTVPVASGLSANDRDPDGNAMTFAQTSLPQHGTLQLQPDGSFTYQPVADYSGPDSFTYQVTDGVDTSAEATVQLTITAVDDAPVALTDAYVVGSGNLEISAAEGVLKNDRDPEGAALSATLVSPPASGTVTLRADGSFTYQPNAGFVGQDRFTYRASDGSVSSEATEVILVSPAPTTDINDPTGDTIVTFNEIMYNPVGNTDSRLEWIELHNQLAIRMDISNWRLSGGVNYVFPEGTVIPGGGYLIVGVDPQALSTELGITGAVGPYTGSLNNAGEELELRNNSDRVMDVLQYSDQGDWPVGADGSGASLAKINGERPSEPGENWRASQEMGGTPGRENFPAYRPDPVDVTLVPWNSTFRYLEGQSPGDGWQTVAYADTNWRSGQTIFQAGDPGFPPTDVGGLTDPGVGLLGYWPLSATSGTVADNVVETGTDGTLFQRPTWTADPVRGFVLAFNGTTQYVDAGKIPAIGLNDDFTWSLWYKQDTASNGNSVILGNRSGGPQDPLQFTKLTPTNFEYYSGAADPFLANTLPNGVWQHLAIVKDGPTLTYYVNGQPVATGETTHGTAEMPLYFGGDPNAAGEFSDGSMDDVAIWNRALPADAVKGLASAAFTPLTAPTAVKTGPIIPVGLPSERTQLAATNSTYYFRRAFEWTGDPSTTQLTLTGLLDDGAVYYLNGQEIYRHNMPAGVITSDTKALSEVTAIGATTGISIPASALRSGTNVLAVELHQSATAGDALFATQLVARMVPANPAEQLLPLLNEIESATATSFRVELFNPHAQPLNLQGYRLMAADQPNRVYQLGDITIAAGGYVSFDQSQLGFRPVSSDALFLLTPGGQRVADAQVVTDQLQGRHHQRDLRWLKPNAATWGAANTFQIDSNIVVNEVMYHAPGYYVAQNDTLYDNDEEWLELYNRSSSETVDLSGWSLADGIDFAFPAGTKMAPGSYLVVAKDPQALLRSRPGLDAAKVLGPFDRTLSNRGDNIVLLDRNSNPVDEVDYKDGGRWPGEADGHAASMELLDPFSDNNVAESWAASDESDQVGWQQVILRGTGAQASSNPTQFNEFILGLLDDGVVLIDDVRVVQAPGTPEAKQLIQNGTFDLDSLGAGPDKWRIIGTQHGLVVEDPTNRANHVLQLTATGATEHMHNNASTTLKDGETFVRLSATATYEVSFKVKWVSGSNQLNSRLYFNRLGTTLRLDRPTVVGTPGAANSHQATNLGPTYEGLIHSPVIPGPNDPVTVSVRAEDYQGVASLSLLYRVDTGAFERVPMALGSDGIYRGTIPAQAEKALVQFYVEGQDAQGATSMFPAAGPESRALYRVETLTPTDDPRHVVRLLMTAADTDFLHLRTNVMSNDRLGATFVYSDTDVYYDVGVRLKGSQRGRNTVVRTGFSVSFDQEDLFKGVHETVGIDRSGSGDEFSQEEIIVRQVIAHAGNLPQLYDDLIHVVAPQSRHTGSAMLSTARYNDVFLDNQYENGSQGTLFEYELIYYPTTTTGGPEGLKIPNPDDVRGVNLGDLGDSKEPYRYHYLIKNNRRQDDYSRLMEFLEAIGRRQTEPDFFTRLEPLMDVDQWLRSFAVQVLTGIGDSYASGSQHNGMFYVRPSDQKVLYMPWDMDFSFTQGASDPLINNNELRKLISIPKYERAYYGHIMDIVNTTFNANYMNSWIDHFDALVPAQPFFQGFKQYINTRSNFAKTRTATAIPVVPFALTTVGPLDVGNATTAKLNGTGWVDVREIRLKGSDVPLNVNWTGKSSWEIEVPVAVGTQDVTLVALDFQGKQLGEVSITVNSTASSPVRDFLRITEVNYNPGDPTGTEPNVDNDLFEFVELTNIGSVPLDLSGVRLVQIEREGVTEGIRFTMSAQTLAPRSSILVVRDRAAFAARYGTQLNLASGSGDAGVVDVFSGQLDNGGETLTLVDSAGAIIQQFAYDDGWFGITDGDGYTLEFVDPTNPDLDAWSRASSWLASSRLNGGPGVPAAIPGDTNLDGEFNSADLLAAFQSGEYEDTTRGNSTWAEGDWNRDGDFTTADFVYIFTWGGFRSQQLAALAAALDETDVDQIFGEW